VWSGNDEERWAAVHFVTMSQLRAFGLGELLWSRSSSLLVRQQDLRRRSNHNPAISSELHASHVCTADRCAYVMALGCR
jgi:hypothetical protein